MRKTGFIILIILLLSFTVPTSLVQAKNTEILINGETIEFNHNSGYPFVDASNRTLVPFRLTLENFGAKVDWDSINNMAIAEKDNIVIKVPIGKNYILKNNKKITIDTVSITKDSRTYLPIRSVIEAFGGQVLWNSVSNTVTLKSESLAQDIHYNAWIDVANKALTQPQYKYGIYVSRSMAVKHPEIYLQADRLAYEHILSNESLGLKIFFKNNIKTFSESEELRKLWRNNNTSRKPLLWSDIDVKEFKKIDYKGFYSEMPLLDYMDIRMYGLATALQPTDMKMVPLNMAEIIYFQEKDIKKNNPYILMTEEGNAYIWSDDRLLKCDGSEADSISQKVILIFNEDYTWYPLMERDDTNTDSILGRLVNTYTSEYYCLPNLTEKEIKLVEILKNSTEIKNEVERTKIKFHSSKVYNGYIRRQDFKDRNLFTVYDKEKNQMRELDTGFVYYVVAKNANYISPITAHYASIAKGLEEQSLNNITGTVIDDFHAYTNTGLNGNRTIAALTLWEHSEYVYTNIDDTWLTKSSNCMYSASNAASILELANIKGLEVIGVSMGYTDDRGGHIYLAIYRNGEKRLVENFGSHGKDHNALINFGTSIFRGFVNGQDWVNFLDDNNPDNMKTYTNKDTPWVLGTLEYIRNRSDSKSIIVYSIDNKTGHLGGINIVDFINKLNSNNIVIYKY